MGADVVLDHLTRMAHAVEDGWAAAWASLGAVPAIPPTLVDDTAACLRVCSDGLQTTEPTLRLWQAGGNGNGAGVETTEERGDEFETGRIKQQHTLALKTSTP